MLFVAVSGKTRHVANFMKFYLAIYVTGFDKTLHMGFFVKIEFDAYLISSTIELFTKSETDRLGASALCS